MTFEGRWRHLDHNGQPILRENKYAGSRSGVFNTLVGSYKVVPNSGGFKAPVEVSEELEKLMIDDDEPTVKSEPQDDYGVFVNSQQSDYEKVKEEPFNEELEGFE